jgi:hypothetical protein
VEAGERRGAPLMALGRMLTSRCGVRRGRGRRDVVEHVGEGCGASTGATRAGRQRRAAWRAVQPRVREHAWAGAYASQSARARGRRGARTRVCANSVGGGWHGGSGRSVHGRPACAASDGRHGG